MIEIFAKKTCMPGSGVLLICFLNLRNLNAAFKHSGFQCVINHKGTSKNSKILTAKIAKVFRKDRKRLIISN